MRCNIYKENLVVFMLQENGKGAGWHREFTLQNPLISPPGAPESFEGSIERGQSAQIIAETGSLRQPLVYSHSWSLPGFTCPKKYSPLKGFLTSIQNKSKISKIIPFPGS